MRLPRRAAPPDRVAAAARSNLLMGPLIAGAGLLAMAAVARTLSEGDFALYAVAIALRGTVQFLADMGTGAASSRMFAQFQARGLRGQALRLYGRLLLARGAFVTIFIGSLLTAPVAAGTLLGLHDDESYLLALVAALAVAEIVAALGSYVLVGTMRQPVVNRIMLGQGLFQPAAVIAAAIFGFGLPGILGGVLAGSLLKAGALNTVAVRMLRGLQDTGTEIDRLGSTYARVATASIIGKAAAWVHSRQFVTLVAVAAFPRSEVATFAIAYDLTHQVLNLAAAPLYSLLLPAFASRDQKSEARQPLFMQTTRALALITLPTAALFIAVFPALVAILFGSRYADTVEYANVIVPGFAIEIILSGPATSLMLASDRLTTSYGVLKLLAFCLGGSYLLLTGTSLLTVTAVMMSVRVASAVSLHAAIRRRTSMHIDARWVAQLLLLACVGFGLAAALAHVLPGHFVDLVIIAPVFLVFISIGIKSMGLLLPEDAAVAQRVVPQSERIIRGLIRAPRNAPASS